MSQGQTPGPDSGFSDMSPEGRRRFLEMMSGGIDVYARGMAHSFRGDPQKSAEAMELASKRAIDQAMNYLALSVALAQFAADRIGCDPADLLDELADEHRKYLDLIETDG